MTSENRSEMSSALQSSLQAAKIQKNNVNSQRTTVDQQQQSKQHMQVLAFQW